MHFFWITLDIISSVSLLAIRCLLMSPSVNIPSSFLDLTTKQMPNPFLSIKFMASNTDEDDSIIRFCKLPVLIVVFISFNFEIIIFALVYVAQAKFLMIRYKLQLNNNLNVHL